MNEMITDIERENRGRVSLGTLMFEAWGNPPPEVGGGCQNGHILLSGDTMQTEIILYLDDNLVKKANHWAQIQNVSLSEMIATFFKQLPEPEQPLTLSPWTQSLVGILKTETEGIDDETLHQQYLDYLEEKYQ